MTEPHILVVRMLPDKINAKETILPYREGDMLRVVDGALLIMNGSITCQAAFAPGDWVRAQIFPKGTADAD